MAARRALGRDGRSIGADDAEAWREIYGIDDDGAVLVRPDGHVGWRSAGGAGDPGRTLGAVLSTIQARA